MFYFFEFVLATFLALIPISNPFSTVPLFLSLTGGRSKEWSETQARRASFFMIGILLVFLWSGAFIIEFFGISIPAIRIAGGAIIMRVGFAMLSPQPKKLEANEEEPRESVHDIAFTPLAMPSLSGPGSIAVVIGMAASADNLTGYLAISLGILLVAGVAYLALRGAPLVAKVLGERGIDASMRIMGFLLICIAFQFVFLGIAGFFADEAFLEPVLEKVRLLLPQ